MFDLLDLIWIFFTAWNADDRPEARRVMLGCLGLVLLIAAVIAAVMWVW